MLPSTTSRVNICIQNLCKTNANSNSFVKDDDNAPSTDTSVLPVAKVYYCFEYMQISN